MLKILQKTWLNLRVSVLCSFVGKEQCIPIHYLLKYCNKSISDQDFLYSFQTNITHKLMHYEKTDGLTGEVIITSVIHILKIIDL